MKIVKYLMLELLFIAFAIMWGRQITCNLKPQEICLAYPLINNSYLEFEWNNYFHWFRTEENIPCRFTSFDKWVFFVPVLIFYTIFKSYGSEHWNKSLTWPVIIPELFLYIIIYLCFIITRAGFIITIGSISNAALGTTLFLAPLIIYAMFITLSDNTYLSPNNTKSTN